MLPVREPLTVQRQELLPTALPTRTGTRCWCQWPSSFVVFVASHIVNPGFDPLFSSGERAQDSDELFEGVDFPAGRPDHGAAFLDNELDAVAGFQAEAFANLLRNRQLAFAADGAKMAHLYQSSLL